MYCLYTRVMSSLDWPNVVLVSGECSEESKLAFCFSVDAVSVRLNVIPLS